MKRLFARFVAAALCGCASQPQIWINPAATPAQAQRDEAQCDYEANAATANYGSGETARTTGGAIGQGFGAGLGRSIEIRKLSTLCMRAKGYALQSEGSSQQVNLTNTAPTTTTPVAAPPIVGRKFDIARLQELTPGRSAMLDARKLFGPPESESTFGNGTTLMQWYYVEAGGKGAHVAILFATNTGLMIQVTLKSQTGF